MSRAVQALLGSGGPTPISPPSRGFISLTQNLVLSGGENIQLILHCWLLIISRPITVERRPKGGRSRRSMAHATDGTPHHPLHHARRGPNTHLRCEAGCLRGGAREVVQPPVVRRSSDTPTPTPQCPKTPHKKRYAGSLASSPVRIL